MNTQDWIDLILCILAIAFVCVLVVGVIMIAVIGFLIQNSDFDDIIYEKRGGTDELD